ncbi:MAG: hypothetical protein ACTHKT_09995 [Solirubrobacterales bacterium]
MREESKGDRQAQGQPALAGRPLKRRFAGTAAAAATLLAAAAAAWTPGRADAVIAPPVVLDGPSSQILELGGAAMAPDGTGGVVYLKSVEGVPHVFVSRLAGGAWSAPLRVDWDQPYAAGEPRIAAGKGGRLLVVWATGVATVKGQVRYGLFSAALGPGAEGFGPALLVDPDLGEGVGVDPSLSGVAPGTATVAYRVITNDFNQSEGFSTAVQLRPGDVMADIRLARLGGDRWSRIGAVNRNPEASMRPPSPTNGPQVGAGVDGNAVVAWQEPDQTGAARIWMRRVFGTTLGPPLEASPAKLEGAPVTADADAFALATTPRNEARVAFRLGGSKGRNARLLMNALPPDYAVPADQPTGPVAVFEAPQGQLGPPAVAAAESGGSAEGKLSLAFSSGGEIHQLRERTLAPAAGAPPLGPKAVAGAEPVVALDPEGGGTLAYAATDPLGRPVLAVRQEFPSAAVQTGLLSTPGGGAVSQLVAGTSGSGDALLGFRQGEAGAYEIVAARVTAPPAAFKAKGPKGWVRPGRAKLRWRPPAGADALTYSVLIEGRLVRSGLRRNAYLPPRAFLPSGRLEAQVVATDGSGQEVVTPPVRLRVDALPPRAALRVRPAKRTVAVRIRDAGAGLVPASTRVAFGDGSRLHGGAGFRHSYARPGRFTVLVRARDRLGNRLSRRFQVSVR